MEAENHDEAGASATQMSRRRFLRATGSVALLASSSGVLAACGSASSPGGGGKKVGLLLPSYTERRWRVGDQAFFESEAKKLGLTVHTQVANDDETVQANQADNLLSEGVDVLVIASVNVDTSKTIVQKAKAQGVAVVSYNFLIADAAIDAAVGRDDTRVGTDLATAAVKAVPKGNYVLVLGDQGTSVARRKAAGKMAVLKPRIAAGDIKVVSERFTKDWDPDLAQKQVENALTANRNDVVAVLASNDTMAYGAIQALRAQGLTGKVFITGEDAEVDALREIKQGTLSVSSFTPFNQMGIAAARVAAQLAAGKAVTAPGTIDNGAKKVPYVNIAAENVTKENLDAFVRANPWWVTPAQL
jgi:D-xylose transport system substrate-binding protein